MIKSIHALLFAISLLLISCDSEVGEDGVVQNAETGERLEGVAVEMRSSEQGSKMDTTDANGYFHARKTFSCGIVSCNTDFSIRFTKEGFQPLTIGDDYWEDAEYVNQSRKDTMIVKLVRAL